MGVEESTVRSWQSTVTCPFIIHSSSFIVQNMIANTPPPPYYAVIFSSLRTDVEEGYAEMAQRMLDLAAEQPGYLGNERVRDGLGITISYWDSLEAIRRWKMNTDHLLAQKKGRSDWYSAYKTRICKVERDYGFEK